MFGSVLDLDCLYARLGFYENKTFITRLLSHSTSHTLPLPSSSKSLSESELFFEDEG